MTKPLDQRLSVSFEIIQILWWQAVAAIMLKRAENAKERLRLHLVDRGANEAVAQSQRGASRVRWGYAKLSDDKSRLLVRAANDRIIKLMTERAKYLLDNSRIGDAQLQVVDHSKDLTDEP